MFWSREQTTTAAGGTKMTTTEKKTTTDDQQNYGDDSLLSQMTDVSDYRPATEKTEEEPNWRMTLNG
jgi:hypothetical protein